MAHKNGFISPLKLFITSKRLFCTAKECTLGVKIPKRINRSPTDILEELAKTVNSDPTAIHYKFPDDPYFFTRSNLFKRSAALSKESGRKSARWIVENHPDLFKEKISDPLINAFIPPTKYDEESDVVEDTLLKVIYERNVPDALIIYDLLQKKNVELSLNTKQHLLELICFYNAEEKPNETYLENKWHIKTEGYRVAKTWRDDGFAEKLFASIIKENPDCPLAYSAIIQGMLKYGQVTKGVELFNYMRDKNVPLSLNVYNLILANVNNIVEGERWKFILSIFQEMAKNQIKPDIRTMNAALESLFFMENFFKKGNAVSQIISEFKSIGIEPSLGTYYYYYKIKFAKYRASPSAFLEIKSDLNTLLEDLVNKELEIKHKDDIHFFPSLMEIFAQILKSSALAKKLHKLVMSNDNTKFLNSNTQELMYYKNYLFAIFSGEDVEYAMKAYSDIVPAVFIPDTALFIKILRVIKESNAFEYLPVIWDDIASQSRSFVSKLLHKVSEMVIEYEGEDPEIRKSCIDIISFCLKEIIGKDQQYNLSAVDERLVSNVVIGLVKLIDEPTLLDNLLKLMESVFYSNYFLNFQAQDYFFNFCLSSNMYPQLMKCLKYSESFLHPRILEMAECVLPHLSNLDENDSKWVTDLIEKIKQKSDTLPN